MKIDHLFNVDGSGFSLNPVGFHFENDQEAAQFLIEAIKFWAPRGLFVDDVTDKKTGERYKYSALPWDISSWDDLTVSFRMYKGKPEYNFVPVVQLIDLLLPNFRRMEFVRENVICGCGCGHIRYEYSFSELEFFAKDGHEGFQRRNIIKQQKELESKNAAIDRFSDVAISSALRAQLLDFIHRNGDIRIINPNVAVMKRERLDYGFGGGGTGYYDQVMVLYQGQRELKEWCWRDRYSASNDKDWLAVNEIGEVKVFEDGDKITVEVELINNQGKRTEKWFFDKTKEKKTELFSAEAQAEFQDKANKEIDRIKSHLDEMWQRKVKMFTADGYAGYIQPSIKQLEIRPELGIAAFLTEEQIDHRVGGDRQMRRELFVLVSGKEKAELVAEDHGYASAGGAVLAILDVDLGNIDIDSKRGRITIPLKNNDRLK